MGLFGDTLRLTGQTCTIPDGEGTKVVPCRAERAERVGGGGFYYQDWVVYLEEYVPYGADVTVGGDSAARQVYDCREMRALGGGVVGYKLTLGHLPPAEE